MQIGRFFSAGKGQVGQYFSPRVLVIRTPFQKAAQFKESCYLGFEKLSQAQNLARSGQPFQLRTGQMLSQFPYEIKLSGDLSIARVLGYWDRLDQKQFFATDKARSSKKRSVPNERSIVPLVA